MKRHSKDKDSGVSGFLRYFRNEMSGKERNTFERGLQKDPFAEEAAEGFNTIDHLTAQKDLEELSHKLNRRSRKHVATILYRIAASVAVLLVISSLFLLIDRKTNVSVSSQDSELNVMEIAKAEPYFKQNAPEKEKEKEKIYSPSTEISSPEQAPATDNFNDTVKKNVDSVPAQPESKQEQTGLSRQKRMVVAISPDAASARPAITENQVISGRVISTEDNLPVPGATVNIKGTQKSATTDSQGIFSMPVREEESVTLITSFIGMKTQQMEASPGEEAEIRLQPDVSALSEVVVVGYGSSKKTGVEDNSDYITPEPEGGRKAFDEYIESNIRRPDSLTGQRVVVVAAIRIRSDGTTDSIRIIRSPDNIFSAEAIRLIKEGPGWKPAMQNGTPVDDEVRIRIVFR